MRAFPLGDPADADIYAIQDDADYTAVLGQSGDDEGIVGDLTGESLRLTAGVDGNSVVIAPGTLKIRGRYVDIPETTLTIAGGVSSGNARVDNVVVRYDATATDPALKVRAVVQPGTTAAVLTATRPTLARTASRWEYLVGTARRVAAQTITAGKLTDDRTWAARIVTGEAAPLLLSTDPIGTVKIVGGELYTRRALPGGPAWDGGRPAGGAILSAGSLIPMVTPNQLGAPLQITTAGGFTFGRMNGDDPRALQVPVAGLYRIAAQLRYVMPALGASEAVEVQAHLCLNGGVDAVRVGRGVIHGAQPSGASVVAVAEWTGVLDAGTSVSLRPLSSRSGTGIDPNAWNSFLSVTFERAV